MERKGKTKGKSGSYSLSEGELDEVQRLLNLGIGHGIHLYMLSGMSGCKDIGENYFFNDQIKCFFQASIRHSVSGRHEARRRRALQIQLRNKADSTGHRDASGNANGGGQFQKLLLLISFSFCISSSLI